MRDRVYFGCLILLQHNIIYSRFSSVKLAQLFHNVIFIQGHTCRVSSYRTAQKHRIIGHFSQNIGHFFPKYRTNMIK